jgi:WD40 repeat protein
VTDPSPAELHRLEQWCWQFEAAWRSAQPLRLEDLLALAPQAQRAFLLRELLFIEREYRQRRGETPGRDEYARRFPDDLDLIDEVFASVSLPPASIAAATLAKPNGSAPDTSSATLPNVPGFQILDVLGRGGMGVVYRAREQGLQRLVALKMVRAGADASPEDLLRFRIEGETVARLQHPHIVQIFEVGTHQGQPYIALEYVEGGSLRQRVERERLPLRHAVELVEQLARGIYYAHQQGVVHRDLKPGNILLTASGQPKISDFGLAKFLGEDRDLTRTGAIIGTPSYMAPEQATGQANRIGPASDIYALGAILYELLVGKPPFADAPPAEAVARLMTEDPPTLARLRGDWPRDLITICDRCLEREPGKRYATAEALADDLRRFLHGEPVQARPIGGFERLWKWARRRPAVAGLWAGVVAVTLLGGAGIIWQWQDALTARDQARRHASDADEARDDARRSEEHAWDAQKETARALEQVETQLYFSNIAQARLQFFSGNAGAADLLLDQCPVPRRGWEWRYLRAQLHSDLLTIHAHTGGLTGLQYSPDGRLLASCQREVKVWDAETGRLVRTLGPNTSPVQCVAFSVPDGKYLAAGYQDGSARIWELATWALVQTIPPPGPRATPSALIFLPGTHHLALAGQDRTIRFWDAVTGKEARPSLRLGDAVIDMAVAADGSRFASCGLDGTRIWDAATGKQIRHFLYQGYGVSLSPDGTLVVINHGQVAKVWNVATGQELHTFGGHASTIHRAVFSPDGWTVATTGADGRIFLWNSRIGESKGSRIGHRGQASACCFHPSGRILACGEQNSGDLKLWDLTRAQAYTPASHFDERMDPLIADIVAIGFHADDSGVVVLRNSGQLQMRDAVTGLLRNERMLPVARGTWRVGGIASVSAGGKYLALVDDIPSPRVRVWELSTGRETFHRTTSASGATRLSLSRDGRRLAIAEGNEQHERQVQVHEVPSGTSLGKMALGKSPSDSRLAAPALSPDGRWLAAEATEESKRRLKVWNVETATERWSANLGTAVADVSYSDDGAYLAAAAQNGQIFVWDAATGKPLHPQPLPGIPGVRKLAISPDNRLLAAHSGSRLRLLDLRSGQEVLNFDSIFRHFSSDDLFVPWLAWSRDGQRLAASDYFKNVLVFEASDFETPAAKARLRAEANARAFGWHAGRAEYSLERLPRQPPLETHLQFLETAAPPDQPQRWERAYLHARLGQWSKVLADCDSSPREMLAERPNLLLLQACARYQTGDLAGYQRDCAALLKTDRPLDAATWIRLLQVCLLAPGDDTAPLVELAKRIRDSQPTRDPWADHLLALAYFRSGKLTEALETIEQVVRNQPNWNKRALNALVLAATQQRLGKTEKARESLLQAEQWLNVEPRPLALEAPPRWTWLEWLEARILHAEVASLRSAGK